MEEAAQIVANVASVLAIAGAAWWFLYTTQFKPRIQFDLGCEVLRVSGTDSPRIVEIQFIFENKGYVEHRLYNLYVSVHALAETNPPTAKPQTGEIEFKRRVLPQVSIVPKEYGYFFVRPGVRQVITHTVAVPIDVSIIRVTSSFSYHRGDRFPHSARRVFVVENSALQSA